MVLKKVLIVDDEQNILTTLRGMLQDEGYVVETAKDGQKGLAAIAEFRPEVVLLDIWMPGDDGLEVLKQIRALYRDIEIIMMSGHGTVETAVRAIKQGAFDFLEKPLHADRVLLLLEHAFALRKLRQENQSLKEALHDEEPLIGRSPAVVQLRNLVAVTAPSNGWALIQGENGTGKELVARALHRGSPRKQARFVAVNCAAIPDELIESELFGHEKGAFTGAVDRKIGKFEQAHEGTLFLDEVGDMAPKMQAKILRALQECTIQRVGGAQPLELNLRVIAATNKDLKTAIQKGEFREDLFYRLNVIPIRVAPLRERREDIPALVQHFISRYSPGKPRRVADEVMEKLMGYDWPGNVRELKNWVERVCILTPHDTVSEFEIENVGESTMQWLEVTGTKSLKVARAAFEREFIAKMLSQNEWNISKTAEAIGMERSHLHKKIKTFGIDLSN
jgi:two-component system, NtrC family, nitrogen regulation response regulator NtrX